jgi:glycosyltransferase involved in cell wall biosynthesis
MIRGSRVLDVVNTDHAALNFLIHRVGLMNEKTEFHNDIVCGQGPHLALVRSGGAHVTSLEIPRGLSPAGLVRLLAALLRHLRTHRYSIVHTHNSITGAVGRLAARLARVPVTIHTVHGFHFHERMSGAQRLPWVATERWLSRWCDVLLSQNREDLERARRIGCRPRLGALYIGNGIDLERFRQRRVEPRNPRPVVLSVGRLEPVKNHRMLFAALKRLSPSQRPIVWLVGDGPCRAGYERELAADGLAECVRFLGYRYDIPEQTAAADVAVLTSVKEGMPRALMEAMATGVPVIATDVQGSREVVVEGQTGFLVPLGDSVALAERLARLLDSPSLRAEMGARGAEHARRHFDEARVVGRLVRIYRWALTAVDVADVPEKPEPLHAESTG